MTLRRLLLLLLLPCATAFASGALAGDESLRAEFRAALENAQAGKPPAPPDSEALRAYVIHPYLVAERIRAALVRAPGEVTDAQVAKFLREHAALPVAHELRREWLASLGARSEWGAYLAAYNADTTDPALRCHHYNAWIRTGGRPELREELLALWLTGEQMPQACVAPFQWLKDQGQLTPARTEQRVRFALEAGNTDLVEWLIRQVPAARAEPLRRWQRLLLEPEPELRLLAAQPQLPVERRALLEGWNRFARARTHAAPALFEQLVAARKLDAPLAGELRRELALALAWDREAAAVEQFRLLPDAALDERAFEWRARAALWHRDWEQAAEWLHAMPAELAAQPRWTYFRGRALEHLGRTRQSETIFKALAQQHGTFALLSAWRLQQKYQPQPQRLPYDAALQQQLLQRPALIRARELFLVGRADWANAEWRLALEGLDEAARLQAARLASSWGWHVQTIQMLSQAGIADEFELLYPAAHADEIRKAAQHTGIAPEWIYGVMRQESAFLATAVSPSRAFGLLQLLLPTAREVARRWKLPAPAREDLFVPAINIPLGAGYLRDMADRFDAQFPVVMAAYNAGPNAVARWLPDRPVDADIWIDNIPFNQTRAYAGKVLWHIAMHRWRETGEPVDVAPLLRPVARPAPKDAS